MGLTLLKRLGIVLLLLQPLMAIAGPRDIAWRMHNRLTGVPPTEAVLAEMANLVAAGNLQGAAMVAVNSPYFYNVALKNWVTPWTNTDVTPKFPFNDFTATVIGIVRDDIPFDQVLYGDILYTGRDGLTGVPAYDVSNNNHHAALETSRVDLKADLVRRQQSTVTGITDTAGILTTRGFGAAYFSAGTNRRAVRFTMKNFLCHDMEQLSDTTRSDFHVRRDVTRAPGGELSVFRNKCVGCHSGMDALGGAFAHFDFRTDKVIHEPNVVQFKMNQNGNEFPDGYVTTDNSWINMWTEGPNARLGWPAQRTGNGVKSFGEMVARTKEFPVCMAKQVFFKVCMRDGKEPEDAAAIQKLAGEFAANNTFSMKSLFAGTAAACLKD